MNKLLLLLPLVASIAITGCQSDAKTASNNLSKAADMFEIQRNIVFYNGITGDYMLQMEGKCSVTDQKTQLEVTCKTGPGEFKKHFLGLSHNVTYFAEQLENVNVSMYHNRIIWKPQSIIPNIDINASASDFVETMN